MGGPTGWWTGDTSDRPADALPSDEVESSWLDIVEESPDPHGKFWVTPIVAEEKLIPRVESAGLRSDPYLLEALRSMLSGGSQHDPGQP